jgi:protein KTI12
VKDAIVVADGGAGLNIKGFRYQLWCAAREVGLTCVSIFVNTGKEKCREWNSRRRDRGEEAYDEET